MAEQLKNIYDMGNSIDDQALGFSARVCLATHWKKDMDVAFKVMRHEYVTKGDVDMWQRFNTEAHLLELFAQDNRVVNLIDCGYVSDVHSFFPQSGEIESFELDVNSFIRQSTEYRVRGWRPYLALERKPPKYCLLNLLWGPLGDGSNPFRLPTEDGMNLALQFTDFLVEAHNKNVVYLDHKPEHIYWDGSQLCIIDFNGSKDLNDDRGITPAKVDRFKRTDLRNFFAGVLFTAFTGRDTRSQILTRAPATHPSAPQEAERRFEAIDYFDFGIEETLLPELVNLINQSMSTSYLRASDFLSGLTVCAAKLGWEGMGHQVSNEAHRAREQIRQGLEALRKAQMLLEEAFQAFEKASLQYPANKESHRLKDKTRQFLLHRVLP